jgi:uncharacterized protein
MMLPTFTQYRKIIFGLFIVLIAGSIFFITKLRFSFDFEQFFPQGDPDLEFFREFIEDFEADDNFLLVGLSREQGIFNQPFLQKVDSLTALTDGLPYVKSTQSLTRMQLPVKTPFGIAPIPIIHTDDTSYYPSDREKLLSDERFVRNLVSEDGRSMVVFLKTKDRLSLEESEVLMKSVDSLTKTFNFESYHYLGRANFQKELVWMEKREVAVSTVVAAILVGIVMWLVYRRFWSVAIALGSIGLSMVLFFGLMGAWGRELSAMAALYPVLLVIIGTSDVIHMMSKYIDELRRGIPQIEAVKTTMKEIGLATLMTALTTAIGFATLVTSRIRPIQEFGVNAAVGVMVAYFTVLMLTTAVLSYFSVNDLIRLSPKKLEKTDSYGRIEIFMDWIYRTTKFKSRQISAVIMLVFVISIWGISKIETNYNINDQMPIGQKVTEDFQFFEKLFSGFRPLEYAVFAQNGQKADGYAVMTEIAKLEERLKTEPAIRSISAPTILFKSLNQMFNGGSQSAYKMPKDSAQFAEYQAFAEELPKSTSQILISKDTTKARIATRILDLGADTVMAVGDKIDSWIAQNTNPEVATFRRTGTGYIIDKNAAYVRTDLLEGIAWEVSLIALLMGLMLRQVRMIAIFLIPNLFPLLFAGALIGFLGVDLDAGVSMVFTVIFGISIDDTIHFLSSFNINKRKGMTVDNALRRTLLETGKPVFLTTVILFFGFLVMIFSIHPPSVVIGKLIAVTLITALLSDLFINPLLIRWWIRDLETKTVTEKEPVLEES